MEPNAPIITNSGGIIDENGDGYPDFPEGFRPANEPVKYFGSAQITFIIGWMFD